MKRSKENETNKTGYPRKKTKGSKVDLDSTQSTGEDTVISSMVIDID